MQTILGTEIGNQIIARFKMFTNLRAAGFFEIALVGGKDTGIFLNKQIVFRCLVESAL